MQTKLDEAKAELLARAARVAENSPAGGQLPTGTTARASGHGTRRARVPPALLPAHRPGGPDRPRPGRRLRRRLSALPAGREPPAGHRQRAGAHADRRGERLDVQPLRRRGRHRRHALPGRLGHQRAVPAGPRHPRRDPPADRRPPRRHRQAASRSLGRRRRPGGAAEPSCRTTRSSSPGSTSRSTARPTAPTSSRSPPTCCASCPTSARPSRTGRRCATPRCASPTSCPSEPTADDLRDAGGRGGPRAAALARRRPLHLPRLPRVRAARSDDALRRRRPAPASASCAPTRSTAERRGHPVSPSFEPAARRRPRQGPRAQAAGPDQGQQPRHRAPPVVPRLRRREEVRRRAATSSASAASSGCSPPPRTPSPCAGCPVIRRKVAEVLEGAGFSPNSHDGRDLLQILETYPRDELFQTPGRRAARRSSPRVLYLQERRRLRLYLRQDEYGRYYSALVYLPRDRYTTGVRLRLIDILKEELGGTSVDFTAWNTESILSRLHFVVRVQPGTELPELTDADADRIEAPARRGRPLLGRRLRRGAERRVRRGARRRAAAPLRQRLPRGLQGRPHAARRRRRPASTSKRLERERARTSRSACTSRSARPRRAPLQDLPHRRARSRSPPCCRCSSGSASRSSTSARTSCAARTGRTAWIYDFGLRMPQAATATATTRRRRPRALPGRLRRRLDRRRRRTTASTPSCCAPG